jgi:hypothetical protein
MNAWAILCDSVGEASVYVMSTRREWLIPLTQVSLDIVSEGSDRRREIAR